MSGTLAGIALALAFAASDDADDFFELRVRPLLADHCFRCHGEERAKSELRLDSRAAILKGGKRGPAAVAGKPDESLVVQAVRRDGELAMPPKETLAPEEVAALSRWVELGLPWPEREPTAPAGERAFTPAERAFWSFQPLADRAPPPVRAAAWPQSDLDRFVLAQLEANGLAPAPRADRRTLLRRVTFDLTGLPPTPEEVAAFLADASPDAFATVVDRLLASPQYGERWARHWLDVVRYTDSFDARSLAPDDPHDAHEAWRYRDWVVAALARDLPFADFVQDQVAGDLRANEGGRFDAARVVATGLLALGDWGGGDADKDKLLTDIADDQVNVVGRAFLGLTLGCARCHDHKFDPITQGDYYGLAGIFFSSHILPGVGAKTEGPPLLRLPLAPESELTARMRHANRKAELETTIALAVGGMPLAKVARDIGGVPGVVALNDMQPGGSDTPSFTVNGTDHVASFLTVTLPPHSVALHPSPRAGVAAVWRCPLDTTVAVRGRVTDGDPNCGDGIEWTVERGREVLALGAIANGGAMELAAGGTGEKLAAIALHAGDELRLTILPHDGYECDTTIVEWTLAETSGARAWSLADDVVAAVARDALQNPLPAASGAEWRFVDRGAIAFDAAELARAAADPALAPLCAELGELRASEPPPLQYANGAAEGGVPDTPHAGIHDVAIHERGRYDRLGALVPRRFPRILAGDAQPPLPADASGRRELAAWIVDGAAPLAARVFVNRVWQHHFGFGLVRTPGNFGRMGEAPSHPELLDWLTCRFLESGGSLKALHRRILLSSAWQQSSLPAAATLAADPENRWLGRMNRTRLDAEELRDALLAASGELDSTLGGPAVRDAATTRRALYVMTIRSDRSNYRALFDGADPTAVVDARIETTVAPQALWLLNDDFVLDRAAALARRIEAELPDAGAPAARIARLFELLFARPPDAEEAAIAAGLAERGGFDELAQVLLASNAFVFVD